MISADLYIVIFHIIVVIATITLLTTYNSGINTETPNEKNKGLFLAVFLSLFIGFRPIDIAFVDMVGYAGRYDWLSSAKFDYALDTNNIIFDNLILYAAKNGYAKELFFLLMTSIYYLISFWGIKRIFKEHSLAAYIVWLGSFSTFSYGVNGIKAGAAAALFILALSFYDKKLYAAIFSLVSLGFHHSMLVCIIAYLCVCFCNKSKYYFAFWVLCLIISGLHITYFQMLFGGMSDDGGASYLLKTEGDGFGGKGGFRIDFILYSALPIAIGYIALFKKKLQSKEYSILYNYYLLTNGVWMLCMYASFTNRIAYLSWFVYPIILVYPLLKMHWGADKNQLFKYVTIFNLCFTLVMAYLF